MIEWLAVGIIVVIAALFLGRALYRGVRGDKPACACGQVDCPVAGACTHFPQAEDDEGYDDCPLTSHDSVNAGARR